MRKEIKDYIEYYFYLLKNKNTKFIKNFKKILSKIKLDKKKIFFCRVCDNLIYDLKLEFLNKKWYVFCICRRYKRLFSEKFKKKYILKWDIDLI